MWGLAGLVFVLDTAISYLANTNNRQVLSRQVQRAVVSSLALRLLETLSSYMLIKVSDWDWRLIAASAVGITLGDVIASKWPNFGRKKKRKAKPKVEELVNL